MSLVFHENKNGKAIRITVRHKNGPGHPLQGSLELQAFTQHLQRLIKKLHPPTRPVSSIPGSCRVCRRSTMQRKLSGQHFSRRGRQYWGIKHHTDYWKEHVEGKGRRGAKCRHSRQRFTIWLLNIRQEVEHQKYPDVWHFARQGPFCCRRCFCRCRCCYCCHRCCCHLLFFRNPSDAKVRI